LPGGLYRVTDDRGFRKHHPDLYAYEELLHSKRILRREWRRPRREKFVA
jgi:hypothetical protein